jgi:hypothetical protein
MQVSLSNVGKKQLGKKVAVSRCPLGRGVWKPLQNRRRPLGASAP